MRAERASNSHSSAFLVIGTGKPRHPAFHPSRHELAFDWDDAGSIDLYTIDLDANDDGTLGDLGAPIRRTFLDVKGEQTPTWAPNGHEIAYATNRFGPSVLEIIDLNLSSMDPAYTRQVEPNFTFVTHSNPDYDGDGRWIAFNPYGRKGGGTVTGVVVDSGVLNPSLLEGKRGGRLWAKARLRDRIDASIVHELEENRHGTHAEALAAAARTELAITDGARRICRAMAR